jgi:signal transduction histidine kinase
MADSHLLMAVEDLVENAIVHAHHAEPVVRVTVEPTDDAVAFAVADDGPGIPDQELAVLDTGGETELQHGSGAGLWVVTWIVERSGGELSFETSSEGTTVTIRLPRADDAEAATSQGARPGVAGERPSDTRT